MNKQVLFIMLGALSVAIFVAVVVQANLSPKPTVGEAAPTVNILVASKKLSVGMEINTETVEWKTWPEDGVFKGAIVKKPDEKIEDLKIYGKLLRRGLDAQEPVTTKAIISVAEKGGNFLAASLEPNMRAVSFPVSASTSVGGFVRPGDFVDIILTYSVSLKGEAKNHSRSTVQRYASQTILNDVKVLAVDQVTKEGEREAKVGRTVTVEVDQAGAEALALASTMGDMSLALRGLRDTEELTKQKKTLTTDVSVSNVLKEVNRIQDKASVSTNTVRVYSGSDVQNMPVRAAQE